ncbi:MAG: VOC family protein [Woeseiaceae bacterium]|nr:VOC family protein [Woeseiaceae bacterium]
MEFKSKARTCFFLQDGAEDAARFYTTVLPDSEIDAVYRPDPSGPALVVEFTIAGVPYMTMNGNPEFQSSYSASVSVLTEDQEETDRLWEQLLADGGEEGQCGWLKDRFGIYWQVVPKALPRLMHAGNPEVSGRVSTALMAMKKIDIATLESAAGAG